VLANALKRIGLAERTGRGIDRIYEGSLLTGRPVPDYSSSDNMRVNLFIADTAPDKLFVRMLNDHHVKTGKTLPVRALLVLNYLKQVHRATAKELSQALHENETRAKAVVEQLLEAGLVEAAGTGRGRDYHLSSKVYKAQDASIAYVRQTKVDLIRHEEMILKLAQEQETVTRKDVVELLSMSPPQAYRALQRLVKTGKLRMSGERRTTRYYLNS
jgi:ATP-dependent DNA helicase RecG